MLVNSLSFTGILRLIDGPQDTMYFTYARQNVKSLYYIARAVGVNACVVPTNTIIGAEQVNSASLNTCSQCGLWGLLVLVVGMSRGNVSCKLKALAMPLVHLLAPFLLPWRFLGRG